MPVRFRTKDGKIVHLLIDSNVRYEKDGSFGHTRCFIRDDTGRKIRESHANLLLEETKRSMAMLDNFMSRSLHHLRTPLHVTQTMVDSITGYFKTHAVINDQETRDCREMVSMASEQITQSVGFLDDIADLAKFDQGAVLHLTPEVLDLAAFGKNILSAMPSPRDGVRAQLELRQNELSSDGPSMAVTDQKVLRRCLLHLLNNAVDVTYDGNVTLGIGYKNKRLTFSICDTGPGLEMPEDAAEGDLPVIFQKYHQELVPEESVDLSTAASIREKVEQSINSHKKNGLGIGLSLTYHLVQSLGGEIRCSSTIGEGTKFQFSLPRNVSYNSTVPTTPSLISVTINKPTPTKTAAEATAGLLKGPLKVEEVSVPEGEDFTVCSSEYSTTQMSTNASEISSLTGAPFEDDVYDRGTKRSRNNVPFVFDMPTDILPNVPACDLAAHGVMSKNPPSILVVEDTVACAKMLCRVLSQFKCATKWAENGKDAIDCLARATAGSYDLILMDLRMPIMDGLEVRTFYRVPYVDLNLLFNLDMVHSHLPALPIVDSTKQATRIIKSEMGISIPVIAVTGDDTDATKAEAEKIGFDGFYGKPMRRDDLKSLIKEFTGYEVQ